LKGKSNVFSSCAPGEGKGRAVMKRTHAKPRTQSKVDRLELLVS